MPPASRRFANLLPAATANTHPCSRAIFQAVRRDTRSLSGRIFSSVRRSWRYLLGKFTALHRVEQQGKRIGADLPGATT